MDTELIEKRLIEKYLKKIANEYYWLGVGLGLVGCIILGLVIGYDLVSENVVVIPLEQGQEI
jgi:hypothetical protein